MNSNSSILKECKGILLDLDHTLYDYNYCHTISINKVMAELSGMLLIPASELEAAFKQARKYVHLEHEGIAASHNRMLYFQKMLEILNVNALRYSLIAYDTYWDAFLSVLNCEEGVLSLLSNLKKTKKICLVTDLTAHIQHRKIQKLKLDEYVDYIVSSEEAGKEKPDARMFKLALTKMNLSSSDVCMIGDNYAKDIQGATNLNIYSYWLNREGKVVEPNKMVTEIKSFKELEKYEGS